MNRFLMTVFFPVAVFGATGCAVFPSSPVTNYSACCTARVSTMPLSEKALYDITTTWVTDAGSQMGLAELRGRPQVIAMFYSSCHVACPVTVWRLKQIASSLPKEVRTQVGFVLITFDPATDTP